MSDTTRLLGYIAIGQGAAGSFMLMVTHAIPYVNLAILIAAVLGMVSLKVRGNYLSTPPMRPQLEGETGTTWYTEADRVVFTTDNAGRVVPAKTEFDCTVYDQSTFERRLIEAGIMEADELIICDSLDCLNCAPERERRKKAQAAERRQRNLDYAKVLDAAKLTDMSDERRELALALWDVHAKVVQEEPQLGISYTPNHKRVGQCQSCRDWTTWDHRCPTCVLMREDKRKVAAIEKAKQEAAWIEKNRLEQEEKARYVHVNGLRRPVRRPEPVPAHAEAELAPVSADKWAPVHVIWKWLEEGQIKFLKQALIVDSYEAKWGGSEKPIKKWEAIYDPDTGKHLGDYTTVNGKSKIRRAQTPMSDVYHNLNELVAKGILTHNQAIEQFSTLVKEYNS